jgi:hypothetical protein
METITVGLEFDSVWQSVPPTIEIVNDGKIVVPVTPIKSKMILSFNLASESDCNHTLEIHRCGHDGAEQQIGIFTCILADELDISPLIDHGRFYPIYPEPWISEQRQQGIDWPKYHQRWREWGWNGTWRLDYQAPFYTWLLKVI